MFTKETTSVHLEVDGGGWHVVWYTDDDGGSGNGEDAHVTRWYGTHEACQERAKGPIPPEVEFVPLKDDKGPSEIPGYSHAAGYPN